MRCKKITLVKSSFKKKIISFYFVLILILSLIPIFSLNVSAAEIVVDISVDSGGSSISLHESKGNYYKFGQWFTPRVSKITSMKLHLVREGDDASGVYVDVRIRKTDVNNRFQFARRSGGSSEAHNYDGQSFLDWRLFVITWNDPGNQIQYFINTDRNTDAGFNAWTGITPWNSFTIGGDTSKWYGWIAHVAVFDSVLSAATVNDLITF